MRMRLGEWYTNLFWDAGWSSPVARWAHNPKVGGSNPPPATTFQVFWDRVVTDL